MSPSDLGCKSGVTPTTPTRISLQLGGVSRNDARSVLKAYHVCLGPACGAGTRPGGRLPQGKGPSLGGRVYGSLIWDQCAVCARGVCGDSEYRVWSPPDAAASSSDAWTWPTSPPHAKTKVWRRAAAEPIWDPVTPSHWAWFLDCD